MSKRNAVIEWTVGVGSGLLIFAVAVVLVVAVLGAFAAFGLGVVELVERIAEVFR